MSDVFTGYLLAGGALLLFAVAILSTKLASSRIDLTLGFLIATLANVAFSVLALSVQLLLRTRGLTWDWIGFGLFGVAGAFSTYLGRWFFYESVVRFGPSKASLFQVSSPLFTALLAWLFLQERVSAIMALGMLMAIGGLILVGTRSGLREAAASNEGAAPVQPARTVHERLLGSLLLLGLGSSLAYAIGNILRGWAVRSWNEPIAGAFAGAVVGLALHLLFSRGRRGFIAKVKKADRSGTALYGLVGITTISAQMCFIASMRFIPVSVATLVTLCTPLLILPISRWLFGNQDGVTSRTLIGGAVTLAGMVVVVLR